METRKRNSFSDDYHRIERAIRIIEHSVREQPDLDALARSVNLSPYHFNRLFKRWAGISPKKFVQALTLEYAKGRLAASESLLDASLESGLSGPGRLHDLFVTFEAMTPGEFKRLGSDLRIRYGFHPSPFGECLIAVTERGICYLGFVSFEDRAGAMADVTSRWPQASYVEDEEATRELVARIFNLGFPEERGPFHLHLKGTNFQVNVWKALLRIPRGWLVNYQEVAGFLGRPDAVRAVSSAVAGNPVGYLIPCHRVIRKSGQIHEYRWGSTRKKAIIAWESQDS